MVQILFIFSVLFGNNVISAEQHSPQQIEVNGYPIEYLESGEGAPLLFLHGAISDFRLWAPYIDLVTKEHKFLAYTQRYHGTQPWPDEALNYSRDQHVADLISFIQEMNVRAGEHSQPFIRRWSGTSSDAAKA